MTETILPTLTPRVQKSELDRPSCPACYRPQRSVGYCDRCEASGAAGRHRAHPHRRLGVVAS